MNWIKAEPILLKRHMRLFTPLELQRVLGLTPVAARFFVHRHSKRGTLQKLRNGLYALVQQPPSDLAIANRMYAPSYVSFEYALAYHHLIPETVYTITSATSRPTRTLTAAQHTFAYHRIKRSAFTGYAPTTVEGQVVLLATPEKAVVDYLYLAARAGRPINERLKWRVLSTKRLLQYARLFQYPRVLRCIEAFV